ncbi:MAG: PASTA domain-containing protein [Clostridia bacterium]|nr:PASTA domain-containing protein [Clostridia bacterium]
MSQKSGGRPAVSGPNKTILRRTLFLMIVCGIVAFIVLAAKLYDIQILHHDEYESAAIEQQVRETAVSAYRGTIYDTNGKILAMSASVDTVYISPKEIEMYGEDPVLIAAGLSEILGVDYATILDMTSDTSSWYKTVARKVEEDLAAQVRAFKESNDLKGVKLETDSKRYYPYGSLAAHVIGFVGTDNYGLGGIESEYNDLLSGAAGKTIRSTTAAGTEMLYMNFEDFYDAENGSDLTLTIDASIQYYMEKHLAQAVEDYGIRNGAAAICMDVDTGAILGMVSLGDFDLNDYQTISEEAQEEIDETAETDEERNQLYAAAQQLQWRNKALSDTYEPGSTFKIITLAMALNEGVVDENSTFFCGGSIEVTGRTTPLNCWKTEGHGLQTLTQAVQHSCNVAFVQIGQLVGAQKFYEYAEGFGFINRSEDMDATLSATTGIDLGGESGSIWWSENKFCNVFDKSELAAASFGQTFTITPLQLITAVSACVNGGNLMTPYLVKEVSDSEGNVISEIEPTVVRQVISEGTSAEVCSILEAVVGDKVEGTGKNAYVAGYRIGGKTGTSTKTTKEVDTGEKEYIVSFIGVAPADDPQIAILVLLDNPAPQSETGIYVSGGQMAAPTVGKMMADILPYLGVEAEYTESEIENMDKTVPSITGLTVEQAQETLVEAGLSYRVIGEGTNVTAQLPAANIVVASNSEVIIYADAEPSEDLEEMIDLTDLPYDIARQRLSYYGLFIRTSSSVTDAESQLISAQSIEVGTEVAHGTVVEVTLVTDDTSILGRY